MPNNMGAKALGGYKPPHGPSGYVGKGEHSTNGNPKPVPKKGSSLKGAGSYGSSADAQKVRSLCSSQQAREGQRGH